jgi:hypothetical protein
MTTTNTEVITNIKQNKTNNRSAYYKEYREQNLSHLRNLEKCKYYKNKFGLNAEHVEKFGEFSGNIFKIQKEIEKIKNGNPLLIPLLIELLTT